uniref:Uncharacterized protein n=1 Tax=Candidatus Kentrum sp. DK TaxID=2126562 RepID=A0A450SM27_9GAMM|nr:MAG: hypothetical protein BECKDK2373C_GA0170839_104423 [Candidatus Kentron sp. DK]
MKQVQSVSDHDRQWLVQEAERARQILQEAVTEALWEKKVRGHYAIFADKDGNAIRVEAEDIPVDISAYDPVAGDGTLHTLAPQSGAV